MRASRPALLWTLVSVVLLLLAGGVGGLEALRTVQVRDRALAAATAVAEGQVPMTVFEGGSLAAVVVWIDVAGTEHRTLVPTDELQEGIGGVVAVRYDPAHPERPPFVGDPRPDADRPAVVVLVLALLVPALAWAVRWSRFAAARRGTPSRVVVRALVTDEAPIEIPVVRWWRRLRRQVWLRLDPPDDRGGRAVRYQRVLWDPALGALANGVETEVRTAGRGFLTRTAVPVDGVVALPVGRPRTRPPGVPLRPADATPFSLRSLLPTLGPWLAAVAILTFRAVVLVLARLGAPGTAGAPALVVLVALLAVGWLWAGPPPVLAEARTAAELDG